LPKLGVASTTQPRASSCHARLHYCTQSYPCSPQILGLTWRPLLLRLSLRFTFLIISMSSTREQIATRRKRQRIEADLPLDDPSESQPPKRLKSSIRLAAFYDSLSKVSLTRRALKELDRRTSQANSPQRPASTPRRVTRNTSNQIRRFARDGGLELRDLRGVRPNCQRV